MKRSKGRLLIIIGLGCLVLLLSMVWAIAPSVVDRRFNRVTQVLFDPVDPTTQVLHESLAIADLHADSLLWGRNLAQRNNYGHVDLPRLIDSNVALQVFTVVTKVPTPLLLDGNPDTSDTIIQLALLQRWPFSTWFSLSQRALFQSKRLHELGQKYKRKEGQTEGQSFRIIETQQDLTDYLAQRQLSSSMTAGLLGIEGAQALDGNLKTLEKLYEAGFRLVGLAHFFDNEVSGSAHGLNKGGLTPFGKQVIQRLDERHMIIDLAHASATTIDEVVQLTQRPVIISHTGVKGTCDNQRNLSDRQLRQIAQTGGIIGIGFWRTAVCGDDVNAIVRAIRYTVDQVGVDHVALGSDFDGAVTMPLNVAHLNQITQSLQQEGFSDTEIRQIMGENVIQFLQRLLPTK